MKVQPMNKVDVTHLRCLDPKIVWLINAGYTLEFDSERVFLVRPVS